MPQHGQGCGSRRSLRRRICDHQGERKRNSVGAHSSSALPSKCSSSNRNIPSRRAPCTPNSGHRKGTSWNTTPPRRSKCALCPWACKAANTGSPHRAPRRIQGGRHRHARRLRKQGGKGRNGCPSNRPPGREPRFPQHRATRVVRKARGGNSECFGRGCCHGPRRCDRRGRAAPVRGLSKAAPASSRVVAPKCGGLPRKSRHRRLCRPWSLSQCCAPKSVGAPSHGPRTRS
mmetsp:Transcript_52421/g.152566  ORF Transcript_52421/g.152566 Transcript_52421/m.152566 type:complete len:231 (-) Transcript_52421:753-1445(-)